MEIIPAIVFAYPHHYVCFLILLINMIKPAISDNKIFIVDPHTGGVNM